VKKSKRLIVWNKYGHKCAYCGKYVAYKDFQVDHYYPKRNPSIARKRLGCHVDDMRNLMPSCRRCNLYKRAYQPRRFKQLMRTLHNRIASIYIVKVAIDYGMIKIKSFDGKFYFEKYKENK